MLLFGLYLLFAGNARADELVAGLLCSAVVATFSSLASRIAERSFDFRGVPWQRVVCKPLLAIIVDVPRVAARLARPTIPPGAVQRWRLAQASVDSPQTTTRRALVTLAASVAPNGFVVTVLTDRDEAVVHRLVPAELPQDAEWPL